MAGSSKIEWTEQTWNPFAGCAVLSPGCTNCYAMKMAARLDAMGQPLYKGLTKPSKAGAVWRGTVRANPDALLAPLRRKKPTTYFVNSMSDLFYEKFSDDMIDQVFAVMALSPQHTFQVLTKRAERMRSYLGDIAGGTTRWHALDAAIKSRVHAMGISWFSWTWPIPNVWLGVSAERQKEADERIPLLLQTPAAIRFVSCEPLLGAIDLTKIKVPDAKGVMGHTNAVTCHREFHWPTLDWVIIGGESGPNARPMHPDWARSLRDQCAAAGVPFFFKQWGEFVPFELTKPLINPRKFYVGGRGYDFHLFKGRPEDHQIAMVRLGKKGTGRKLDSSLHSDMPKGRGE